MIIFFLHKKNNNKIPFTFFFVVYISGCIHLNTPHINSISFQLFEVFFIPPRISEDFVVHFFCFVFFPGIVFCDCFVCYYYYSYYYYKYYCSSTKTTLSLCKRQLFFTSPPTNQSFIDCSLF